MSLTHFMIVTGIVGLGAMLQGTIGFGLGLFSAPLLILINPQLVPGPLLGSSAVLTLLLARREWHAVEKTDLAWAITGRIIGTGLAMAALILLSESRLEALFGIIVLTGVVVTALGLHIRPAPRVLTIVGTASGFMGTLTAIGGPPMALLYQHESGPRIRGTLSAFFVAGVALSLTGLTIVGRFGAPELLLSAHLVPGVVLGFLMSRRTADALDRRFIRPAVLAVATFTALAVLFK
jgi:uncharacterized membrane protein YfcA